MRPCWRTLAWPVVCPSYQLLTDRDLFLLQEGGVQASDGRAGRPGKWVLPALGLGLWLAFPTRRSSQERQSGQLLEVQAFDCFFVSKSPHAVSCAGLQSGTGALPGISVPWEAG